MLVFLFFGNFQKKSQLKFLWKFRKMLIELDFFDWTYFRGWNREWTIWCSYQKPCVLCFWRDFHGVFCLLCRTFQLQCKSRMLGPSKCNPVLKVRNWAKIKSGTVQRKKGQKMIPARKYLFFRYVSYPLQRSCICQDAGDVVKRRPSGRQGTSASKSQVKSLFFHFNAPIQKKATWIVW